MGYIINSLASPPLPFIQKKGVILFIFEYTLSKILIPLFKNNKRTFWTPLVSTDSIPKIQISYLEVSQYKKIVNNP
ncbi:MAG: hypothetical protein D3907_13065 [Candidatus Electrothrix sp. AUS3]|nr:hypothetical protein [Candidatus Electrothrix gigas]